MAGHLKTLWHLIAHSSAENKICGDVGGVKRSALQTTIIAAASNDA